MTAVWLNPTFTDEERRCHLYAGDIVVYSHIPAVEAFAAFIREMIEASFAPHDPRHVHEFYSPEHLAPILGKLKPQFTHHPEARRLVISILGALGTDVDDCHLDVPKLRSAYPTGHLTKGIAYAFGAHRDTWYGAPGAQINWWLPAYPLAADNAMAFYPRYFSQPVANDSDKFNYYRRNTERRNVTQFVREDPRIQPSANGMSTDEPEFRLLPEVGGVILFSGAQLHATATSADSLARYSVDFRTVSRRDIERGLGAANVDGHCVGTALRDFRRCSDWTPIPEMLAKLLDPVGPQEGELAVYEPGR
jgi:hypothetical protein